MLKDHIPLCLLLDFANNVPCEHNNKQNAFAPDNLATFNMPFLSIIIAYIISLISLIITLALCLLLAFYKNGIMFLP